MEMVRILKTIRLSTGDDVDFFRRGDIWVARRGNISATGETPKKALISLRPLLGEVQPVYRSALPRPPLAALNRRANVRNVYGGVDSVWRDRATGALFADIYQTDGLVRVTLFDAERVDGFALDVRSAYREACRAQRLARHTVPDLLRASAGLRRMLFQAERKIATDSCRIMRLASENEMLAAENARLQAEVNRLCALVDLGKELALLVETMLPTPVAPSCPRCEGTGQVWIVETNEAGHHERVDIPCPHCAGEARPEELPF